MAVIPVGAPGMVAGIIGFANPGALAPMALTQDTENVYDVPFVNPVTIRDFAPARLVVILLFGGIVTPAEGFDTMLKDVVAAPTAALWVQVSVAEAFPRTAITLGAPGGVEGVVVAL